MAYTYYYPNTVNIPTPIVEGSTSVPINLTSIKIPDIISQRTASNASRYKPLYSATVDESGNIIDITPSETTVVGGIEGRTKSDLTPSFIQIDTDLADPSVINSNPQILNPSSIITAPNVPPMVPNITIAPIVAPTMRFEQSSNSRGISDLIAPIIPPSSPIDGIASIKRASKTGNNITSVIGPIPTGNVPAFAPPKDISIKGAETDLGSQLRSDDQSIKKKAVMELERRIITMQGHCPNEIVDTLRMRSFQLDAMLMSEYLKQPGIFDHEFQDGMGCLIDALVSSEDLLPDQRLRQWISDIRRIGEASNEGMAFKLQSGQCSLYKSSCYPLYVVKTPADPNDDSLPHEAVIGMGALNTLRDKVPTFMHTYGAFMCPPPVIDNSGAVIAWCPANVSGQLSNVTYLVLENINDAESFAKLAPTLTPEEFLQIYLQVLNALNVAYKAFDFTHYDLHPGNVLIQTLSYKVAIPFYDPRGGVMYIKTNRLARIIDYGSSHVYLQGQHLGKYGFSNVGIYPESSFPMYDAYKLLLGTYWYALNTGPNTGIIGKEGITSVLTPVVNKIYTFFTDNPSLEQRMKNRDDNAYNDYFQPDTSYKKVTFDDLILHIINSFSAPVPSMKNKQSFDPTVTLPNIQPTIQPNIPKVPKIPTYIERAPINTADVYVPPTINFGQQQVIIPNAGDIAVPSNSSITPLNIPVASSNISITQPTISSLLDVNPRPNVYIPSILDPTPTVPVVQPNPVPKFYVSSILDVDQPNMSGQQNLTQQYAPAPTQQEIINQIDQFDPAIIQTNPTIIQTNTNKVSTRLMDAGTTVTSVPISKSVVQPVYVNVGAPGSPSVKIQDPEQLEIIRKVTRSEVWNPTARPGLFIDENKQSSDPTLLNYSRNPSESQEINRSVRSTQTEESVIAVGLRENNVILPASSVRGQTYGGLLSFLVKDQPEDAIMTICQDKCVNWDTFNKHIFDRIKLPATLTEYCQANMTIDKLTDKTYKDNLKSWLSQFNLEHAYIQERNEFVSELNAIIAETNNITLLTVDDPAFDLTTYEDNIYRLAAIRSRFIKVSLWVTSAICAFNSNKNLNIISADIQEIFRGANAVNTRIGDYAKVLRYNIDVASNVGVNFTQNINSAHFIILYD
ncbi:Protein kinase [uncultured virus]|nr:Protein kinase [uncultured virus]